VTAVVHVLVWIVSVLLIAATLLPVPSSWRQPAFIGCSMLKHFASRANFTLIASRIRANPVVPHGIPPTVHPRSGHVNRHDIGRHPSRKNGCAIFEIRGPLLEGLVN
jgi:hypothetical protein